MFERKNTLQPCAMALAVALALGLTGCGGGSNVRPSAPPPPAGNNAPSPAPAPAPAPAPTSISGNYDVSFDSATRTWSQDVSGSGQLNKGGTGTLVLTGENIYSGGTTINAGTLQIGNGGTEGSIVGDVVDDGSLVFNHSDDIDYGGVISGTGSLTKTGTGTLTLTSANTYTGSTIIHHGILELAAGATLGTGSIEVLPTNITISDPDPVAELKVDAGASIPQNITLSGVVPGLDNAGTISGDVDESAATNPWITLRTGGVISGALELNGGVLNLFGTTGTTELYSQAATGPTTIMTAPVLRKSGNGAWVIDNNELQGVLRVTLYAGKLQIGDGHTSGWLGNAPVTFAGDGTLVFDRSDNVTYSGNVRFLSVGQLVQAGTGKLILSGYNLTSYRPSGSAAYKIASGTLQFGDGSSFEDGISLSLGAGIIDNGALVFDWSGGVVVTGAISGSGSLTKQSSGTLFLQGNNSYSGGTVVSAGTLKSTAILPGNVTVETGAVLDGDAVGGTSLGVPGTTGNLTNAGIVNVHGGDTTVGGNYVQSSTGTLVVSLGSKLVVSGTATVAGTLEINGADDGYVANTHTEVLTASGGLSGTFSLNLGSNVVFTDATIHQDSTSVWLDTTGLNITTAAAGDGVTYTPASMGSAQRVQGAFEQLDSKIASGSISSVSDGFVQSAGQFQQSPNYRAAQASLESLSGQLHAASAGMTLQAIDATGRALSDRLERLSLQTDKPQMWISQLQQGGSMSRSGFAGVDYQLNGWLVGRDMRLGAHTLAGFAFSQGQGTEQLSGRFDRNRSRHTAGMIYLGWMGQRWYTHGRIGMGHYHQSMNRRLLLGINYQGVWTDYDGHYNVAYGEIGRHFSIGTMRLTPFADLEYDRVTRNGFAEHGAGGFGLKADGHTLSRWQSGLGLKLARQWRFASGRSISLDARAQWRQTLSANGTVFDASFVGLDEWRPLTGVGLSRRSAVFGLDINARPSANTRVKLGYEYLTGDRGKAGVASANFTLRF